MKEKYGDYEINNEPNEWGYFEAVHTNDCDAFVLYAKTIQQLKIEIDEK